ncbi:MAG: glycerate kinase, partial [Actinomycetota bacterium]|nr:glycerate kinase [Actinomycetota bacterium]
RLAPDELDPLRATSRGLGELIQEAARYNPRALLVCLGGSATVDGGEGVREVLTSLPRKTTVLHDVRTTLRDAPRVYGPQKGATPEVIRELEGRLAAMAELRPYADVPGAGAAGGLGAALAALGAALAPGARAVLARIGFEGRARTAALVVTGEGTVDSTTLEGKAPGEAARVCRELGVPCAVFGGRVTDPVPGVRTLRLSGRPERAREDLLALGGQLGRELVGGSS